MHGEVHWLTAAVLYMLWPVPLILYQSGTPIWIRPLPLGSIVVLGVQVTLSVVFAVVLPRVFMFELRTTDDTGIMSCWIVKPGTETVIMFWVQFKSVKDRKFIVVISCEENGVLKLVNEILRDCYCDANGLSVGNTTCRVSDCFLEHVTVMPAVMAVHTGWTANV